MSVCKKYLFCIPLIVCAGCMVGPRYHKPCIHLPEKFAEHQAQGVAQLADWWCFFHDDYLDELIKKAIDNNYDLKIAIEKIVETRAAFNLQSSHLCPEVDATGNLSQARVSKNVVQNAGLTSRNQSYIQTGFDASWELDFWGKLTHEKNAVYNLYHAQIETMRDIYITLLGDVARTYIDSRTLQKKIDLLDEQIDIDTQLLALTNDRLRAGVANLIPDLEEYAALQATKNQRLLLEIEFKQTVNRLALLLGQNPEDFTFDDGHHKVPTSTKELKAGLPSDLLRRRADIRRAEMLLRSATESVGAAVAQWFPSFSLLGSAGQASNHLSKWLSCGSFGWSIGPSINWPIITFGRIKFKVDETKSVERQALLGYGQSVIKALGDVENALGVYFRNSDRLRILERKLSAVAQERDVMQSLLDSGLGNQTDLLIAQKNYLAIEVELTDAQQTVSTALVATYKALGGDWE